jgi:acetoin utilization protein AcuB
MKVERRMRRSVITVRGDESVDRAHTLMARHGIRHLPVVDDGRLVGVLSDRDIRATIVRRRCGTSASSGQALYLLPGLRVGDAMTPDPVSIHPGADIEEAARLLIARKIGCLPVVDDDGRVVGIITSTDILAVVTQILGLLRCSSRIDIALGRDPRALERTSEIIRRHHGRIISVGVSPGHRGTPRVHHFRLSSCDLGPIADSLRRAGFRVLERMG